jgi:ribose/galactose isomerase
MSISPQDLEQIVKEVLRRLREREITNEIRTEASGGTKASTLKLAERVVTLATLKDKLAGVKTIVVPRGAIITPLVRDELKATNIKLEFADRPSDSKRAARQLLVAVTTTFNPTRLLKRLAAAGINTQTLTAADGKEAVKKMTKELENAAAAGVILTDHPAATACVANRDPAVRAAVAADARSAQDALESLDANLLVVDPAAHSLFALEKIIREYAQSSTVA